MMRVASPGPSARHAAGQHFVDDAQAGRRGAHIGHAYGITIDDRLVPRRGIEIRGDFFSQHQPERRG
jgi:hypothetical protein